jgi:hypothetical protein
MTRVVARSDRVDRSSRSDVPGADVPGGGAAGAQLAKSPMSKRMTSIARPNVRHDRELA